MKTIYNFLFLLLFFVGITACNEMEYGTNDPDANLSAPTYYDVQDSHQVYSTYWRPKKGWVGDPMPYFENGSFYVFYLHDARDGAPTFHPWNMSATNDFMSYNDFDEMIATGSNDSQEGALGTGSVIKKDGTYYAFYTAHNERLQPAEKIYLATSSDLKTWTKQPDFSLKAADNYDANEFRDPFVYRDGNMYRMLVTSRGYVAAVNDWQAVVAQYTSTDLMTWKLVEPLYYNGNRVLECPDVFTMGNFEYLIYSNWDWANTDRRVLYRYRAIGTTDWLVPENAALDDILFYAGRTASDGKNRYLFGWVPTREGNNDNGAYHWGGNLVMHQLEQNSDGILRVVAPEKITSQLTTPISATPILSHQSSVSGNTFMLSGTAEKSFALFDRQQGVFHISASVQANSAKRFGFEFGAGGNRNRLHNLVFDIENGTLSQQRIVNGSVVSTPLSVALDIPADKKFEISIIIENSVCVIYVNNKIALTNRIYQMNQNPWGIFAENGNAAFTLNISKK